MSRQAVMERQVRSLGRKPKRAIPVVAAYFRVSTDMQAEEGHSLAMQEEEVRARLDREFGAGGYRLIIERDEGVSGSWSWEPPKPGSRKFRRGLARIAALLEAGEVDVFIVYRLDRAFRNLAEQLRFRQKYLHAGAGVQFISVKEKVDLTDPMDVTANDMFALLGEHQRKVIRQNVTDALAQRRRDGYPTGTLGYGWLPTPKGEGKRPGLTPDPERAPWVRKIYAWYLAGWGTQNIARELDRLDAPRSRRSTRWRPVIVQTILRNPLHAGLIADGDGLYPGIHWDERLIEPEEYARAVDELARRKREPRKQFPKGVYPLFDLARCSCGTYLTAYDRDGVPSYRCPGSMNLGVFAPPALPAEGTRGYCTGWSKSVEIVDRQLLTLLTEAVQTPEFQRLVAAEAQLLVLRESREAVQAERDRNAQALVRLREQRLNLTTAFTRGLAALEDYERLFGDLQASIARTEGQLQELDRRLADEQGAETLLVRIRELLPQVPRVWEALQPEERRQLLRDLTESIVVAPLDYGTAELRVQVPYLPPLTAALAHGRSLQHGPDRLTRRELAVLCLMVDGLTYREVLERWGVRTGLRTHLKQSILRRLGVETLEEAVALAAERIAAERPLLPLDCASGEGDGSWSAVRRERIPQVLQRYLSGLTRDEIAADLGLTPGRVRTIEWQARRKYQVRTLEEALAWFRREREGDPAPTSGS